MAREHGRGWRSASERRSARIPATPRGDRYPAVERRPLAIAEAANARLLGLALGACYAATATPAGT